MEVLNKINGWTLYFDNKEYIQESPEGHRSKVYALNEDQANQRFLNTIERGWVWVDYVYYTAHVYMSKIETERHMAQHKSNQLPPNGRFTTKDDAISEIKKVLPKAEEKFSRCLNALKALQEEMDFSSGDTYEGDTHGTYNDHSYISFKMDGFNFSFEV